MDKTIKRKALQLLKAKETDSSITYSSIERQTGYSKRQLIRMSQALQEKDMDSVFTHGNTGRKPVTAASAQEISYLREFKKPYPNITIAQFRDIFIEDVIENPSMQEDVDRYCLKPRSFSWFRQLFMNEGWESPASREPLFDKSRPTHPMRKPRPSRGELEQIDGTPFDWFNDDRVYTLHLAVDDATTEVISGWFMPTECMRGYCRMMRIMLEKRGCPMALYSDRDSVFRSVKNGAPTQFSHMMDKLGIKCILAGSPQAKGRVERYNGTIQGRLPNDIIRFKIPHDYNILNEWLNTKYIPYINKKFSFLPLDPHDVFIPMPSDYDYSNVFRAEYKRIMRDDVFSFETNLYSAFNEDGELVRLKNGTTVHIYIDALTDEMYIERYGKRYACIQVGQRRRTNIEEAENRKQLTNLLNNMRWEKEQ
ncbi:MAG: hypothetical protein LKE64_10475 [Solobacterium sp.]|nr:hypothetical protein [Solobacterium sp.]MCH4013460.1 hypothetical protein [Solobacterium sp.]MCH4013748.1 hypothetical protein [Solobacterium sp.]MCH4014731.1 hypothetical protein [Solobacterium sp.]MCH4048352.1 hypothetical protein [Solobacterium sp.]